MGKAIGIDLGTTNSVMAFKDTAVKIIRNSENQEQTRSCVSVINGEELVGKNAYNTLLKDPVNTILSVKRLMGGAIKDKMVQEMVNNEYYQYQIVPLENGTDDGVAVELGGKQYTPEQISAKILSKLKADAKEKHGEVTHAVITVPAYFTENQKNATTRSAQLAGLKLQKLLPEPTAAAIAYGLDNLKEGEQRTVLIYDFGGGTFDLSILSISDGQYIEAGTGGDRWLGGDDIDAELQKLVKEKVCEEYGIKDLDVLVNNLTKKQQISFTGQMKMKTEEAKMELSSAGFADVDIDNLLKDDNDELIDINVTITRDELEQIVKPLITRSIELIGILFKETNYDMNMIDNILLVGGTSCIPLVKKMLSEKYGADKILLSEKPMLAIAEGAAILSHRLGDTFEAETDTGSTIEEIISCAANHNYFIDVVEDDARSKLQIIEKQSPLPAEKTVVLETTTNNQKIVKVAISAKVEDGKYERQTLGYYLIEDNLPLKSELVFDICLDINESFTVNVYPKGQPKQSKNIVLARGGVDSKALKTIDELIVKATKEYKTADGEQDLLNYITQKIKEIDEIGATKVKDDKWHEVYYTTTEKYDEIKANEKGVSSTDSAVWRAQRLLYEFGDIMEPSDKTTMVRLLSEIDADEDGLNKEILCRNLKERTDQYPLHNKALHIKSLADRISNLPVTEVGTGSTKIEDINRLLQISEEAKTKLINKQDDAATELVDEAYEIINKYRDWL